MAFQIGTIFILTLFYGCYIIKMIIQKRSGIKTDCLGKEKSGFTKRLEIILKFSTCSTFAAEIVSLALNTTVFPIWLRTVGFVFAITGTFVFIIAVYTMKDSWRAGVSRTEKTKLVTSSIFQISRNPAFLGFDLIYIGIVFMFFNVPLFLISIFSIIILHLQIVCNEEPFLQETFGKEYFEYEKHVNRYIGKRNHSVKKCSKIQRISPQTPRYETFCINQNSAEND